MDVHLVPVSPRTWQPSMPQAVNTASPRPRQVKRTCHRRRSEQIRPVVNLNPVSNLQFEMGVVNCEPVHGYLETCFLPALRRRRLPLWKPWRDCRTTGQHPTKLVMKAVWQIHQTPIHILTYVNWFDASKACYHWPCGTVIPDIVWNDKRDQEVSIASVNHWPVRRKIVTALLPFKMFQRPSGSGYDQRQPLALFSPTTAWDRLYTEIKRRVLPANAGHIHLSHEIQKGQVYADQKKGGPSYSVLVTRQLQSCSAPYPPFDVQTVAACLKAHWNGLMPGEVNVVMDVELSSPRSPSNKVVGLRFAIRERRPYRWYCHLPQKSKRLNKYANRM